MSNTTTKRAAVYLRLSRDHANSVSVDNQRRECERFAKAKGWEVVEVYEDIDVSGRKGTRRPGFDRMLADLHRVDVVVSYRLDRFTRGGIVEFARILDDHLTPAGVRFASATEEFLNTDTADNPFAEIILVLVATFAKLESDTISRRVTAARRRTREVGRWTGGHAPYGHRIVEREGGGYRLAVVEEEAEILRGAVERVLNGATLAQTARYFTEHPDYVSRRGNDHCMPFIARSMLTSSTMCGWMPHNREPYLGEDGTPVEVGDPIIEPDTWRRVRAALAPKHEAHKKRDESPLLMGIIRCGHCGYGMTKSRTGKYAAYQCRSSYLRGKGVCPGVSINRDGTDAEVTATVRAALPAILDRGAAASEARRRADSSAAERIETLTQAIGTLTQQAADLLAAGASQVRITAIDNQIDRLDADLNDLLDAEERATESADIGALRDLLGADPLDTFDQLDDDSDARRAVVATVIDRVEITPKKPGARNRFDPGRVDVRLRAPVVT